jgi:hypothetical protein
LLRIAVPGAGVKAKPGAALQSSTPIRTIANNHRRKPALVVI